MKILQDGVELFHMDGRMDSQTGRQVGKYDEANSRFSQFFECVTNTALLQPKFLEHFPKRAETLGNAVHCRNEGEEGQRALSTHCAAG